MKLHSLVEKTIPHLRSEKGLEDFSCICWNVENSCWGLHSGNTCDRHMTTQNEQATHNINPSQEQSFTTHPKAWSWVCPRLHCIFSLFQGLGLYLHHLYDARLLYPKKASYRISKASYILPFRMYRKFRSYPNYKFASWGCQANSVTKRS